jgi:flagellar biosynthesis chaperone FliJ
MSFWIWMRHRWDPSLRRATAQLLAGNSLENAREKIECTLCEYTAEEKSLQEEFSLAIARIQQISNEKIKNREIKSLAPKLSKLKRVQTQIQSLSNQVNVIERQIDSFRTEVVQTDLLTSLRDSITVLKETSRDQAQTKCVDEVLDDMDEVLSKQQNFNESLTMPFQTNTMSEPEDADLMTELFSMFDDEGGPGPPSEKIHVPMAKRPEKESEKMNQPTLIEEVISTQVVEEVPSDEPENQRQEVLE